MSKMEPVQLHVGEGGCAPKLAGVNFGGDVPEVNHVGIMKFPWLILWLVGVQLVRVR